MNHAKALVLAGVESAELREALQSIPGAYFEVALATADDAEDRVCVLRRVVDLYGQAVGQMKARADALEAQLAQARRSHLSIVGSERSLPASSIEHVHSKGE